MEQPSLLIAFGAGVLSFLSPCVLPLVPVYLASLAGPEIFASKNNRFHLPIFLHALSFVVGFSLIFTLWGAGVGLVSAMLSSYLHLVRQVSGSLLIILGVFLLVATKLPWLNFEKRLAPSQGTTISYLRSFLTGAIFSLAWTPCVGPVLAGILALALSAETAAQGAYLLASYSFGLGLPFLIIGAAFGSLAPLLKGIQHYSGVIYILSGVLLIAIGILVLMNRLAWFQTLV